MSWTKPYHPPKNQRLDADLYQHTGWITFITIRAYEDKAPITDTALAKLVVDLLHSEQERLMCNVYTYFLSNPLRKALVASESDWPWSGQFIALP